MPLFKNRLYAMSPYQPPLEGRSVERHLLLDFNERTLAVDASIEDALIAYIRSGSLQKYPAYGDIVERIAAYVGVPPDCLMITNGSDQGLDLVIRAVCGVGDEVIIPAPSFAIYRQFAEVEGARIIEPLYSRQQGFPLNEVLASVNASTRLIVVPNPNNPCGTLVEPQEIVKILEAAPDALVLVDECYFEYSATTVAQLVQKYPNLVVARTFSKTWGLSSLRLGFLVSAADNIAQLMKIRGPYDINQLAVVAVEAALKKPDYTRNYVAEVMGVSKLRLEQWCDAQGIDYWPSRANFVWLFPSQPQELASHLESRGILVRPKRDPNGLLGLRITVGTSAQTERLLQAMDELEIKKPAK